MWGFPFFKQPNSGSPGTATNLDRFGQFACIHIPPDSPDATGGRVAGGMENQWTRDFFWQRMARSLWSAPALAALLCGRETWAWRKISGRAESGAEAAAVQTLREL